ncbi:ELM2 and SANT domain-containing protein 1 [Silurus asotus]|uniref:ELM2 and SANT domain-containing protein 1 n=1 Tax=Silurus asotus TaxID=30991 RepID=A0AAD5A280_SILAS|nr:ELM2 and SANT domain-containing protein 1 [Silurus asotus]
MANKASSSQYAVMEVMESSDINLPLLSENLPNGVIVISPMTPSLASLPAQQQQQLWVDTECEVSTNPEGMQRGKVVTHKCSKCSKVFETSIGHMLTHKKKKDYRCSHVGCQKMYCGYKSLQRHCATQHGASLLPSFTQSSSINTQTCPPLLEPPTLPPVKDGASTSTDFHSYLFPTKPLSAFQFEGYTGCGTSYTNYTLSGNPSFSCNPQDSNLSKVKLSEIPQSWSLTADGASCSFDSAVGLSESHGMDKTNQWASTGILGGSVVGPEEPETVHIWEWNSQQGVLTNFQAQKEAPTRQPNKGIGMRMGCRPSSAFTRNSQADLLKLSMRPHEPQNNQQMTLMRGVASCTKLNIVGSSAHQIEPIIPPLSPATKTKKKRLQNILKPANIPTPPLPSPKPTTQRRPRAFTADLVSPSQVAMASFSKKTAPADPLKGGSATTKTRKGKESGERIYLKYPPRKHEQFSPSCPQVPTTSCKIDQLLMDPISTPKIDKQHKSRHPGHLQNLTTPVQVAGGYPSQLRSPIYLADHLLNFDPPPYTPPPMLSPLRTGTGLYFNTLPQCQPSFPPPNIYSSFLDGKDGISLTLDKTVTNIEPKINVGSRFQAEIPPLRNPLLILYDEHPADLTWAPWGDLPSNPKTQQKGLFLSHCSQENLFSKLH